MFNQLYISQPVKDQNRCVNSYSSLFEITSTYRKCVREDLMLLETDLNNIGCTF